MKPTTRVLSALAALTLFACAETPSPQPSPGASPAAAESSGRHVLAVVALEVTGPRLLSKRMVDGPMQIDRAPQKDGWKLEVSDEEGTVLHSAPLRPVGKIRGEFVNADGQLEHHEVEDPSPVITLRMPVIPKAARLRILDVRELWDEQGKPLERDPATIAQLSWSEVLP